jgi:hypothetical protein
MGLSLQFDDIRSFEHFFSLLSLLHAIEEVQGYLYPSSP